MMDSKRIGSAHRTVRLIRPHTATDDALQDRECRIRRGWLIFADKPSGEALAEVVAAVGVRP